MTNATVSGSHTLISGELESIKFGIKEVLRLADDLDSAHDRLEQDAVRASSVEETNAVKMRAKQLSTMSLQLSKLCAPSSRDVKAFLRSR